MYSTNKGCLYLMKRRRQLIGIWIKQLAELVVLLNIKIMGLHEPFLLCLKTALKEPLKSGLRRCPEKKAIAQSKVDGGHKEANGLHYIPT